MKSFVRYRLKCLVALAVYLLVNVGGMAWHHHPGVAAQPENLPWFNGTNLQFQTSGSDDDDDGDDEEHCLLCRVLHLVQSLAGTVEMEGVSAHTDQAATAIAQIRPYPLATILHSRGPPLQ